MSLGTKVQAGVDDDLLKFEKHKNALLTILRNAHVPGSTAGPFDEVKAWFNLTNIAASYFFGAQVKQVTMPLCERVARLRRLANALSNARSLTDKAMQDEVGDDLYSEWCRDIDQPQASVIRKDDGSLGLTRPALEMFSKVVTGLTELEAAALRAVHETHKERAGGGRPKGTSVLPPGFILALASVFQKVTDMTPSGKGPFGRLARGFLDAVGHEGRLSGRHIQEMIEDECGHTQANPGVGHLLRSTRTSGD